MDLEKSTELLNLDEVFKAILDSERCQGKTRAFTESLFTYWKANNHLSPKQMEALQSIHQRVTSSPT